MGLTGTSSVIISVLLAFAIIFELAVVVGIPLGQFTAGGKYPTALPLKARLQRLWFVAGWSALLGHYLAQLGILTPFFDSSTNQVINWILASALALGVYYNSRSTSVRERALWMPVLMIMLICALLIALK